MEPACRRDPSGARSRYSCEFPILTLKLHRCSDKNEKQLTNEQKLKKKEENYIQPDLKT